MYQGLDTMRTRQLITTITIAFLALVFASPATNAEIYRWIDEDGRVHFSDQAPEAVDSETIDVRPQTYESPSIEALADVVADDINAHEDKVVMYSAEWCGVCKRARSFFLDRNIPFEEYDVENTAKGKRDYKKMGAKGVPVILVGSKRLNGFSPGKFMNLYSMQ